MPRLTDFAAWADTHIARAGAWLTRWAQLDSSQHEPGFLGSVPYALILRFFIVLAIILRLHTHWPEYSPEEKVIRFWLVVLYAVMAVVAGGFVTKPRWRRSPRLHAVIIVSDVIFISVAYWLTGAYGSDFFLFYYLPIFESIEYFGAWGAVSISAGVGLAMALVGFGVHAAQSGSFTGWPQVFRVLSLRWLFLLAVAAASTFVFSRLSRRQAELVSLLDALHKSAAALPNVRELDQILERILTELTEDLRFEFATISLVDEYRNCIETVRGRNISPGWIMRAKHLLNVRDIQTHVVNTGETKKIIGWDDLLDRDIYDRFEHWKLARVWAPIVAFNGFKEVVVGTIETGCNKERADELLTDAAIERVKELGREKGPQIAGRRPHVLLEKIAGDAIQLIGADSASLHVYRRAGTQPTGPWGELVLAAGAGKATPAFVRSYEPSEHGRGRHAIETGEPVSLDDPQKFAVDYPKLYELGVRALAVIPIKLGSDTQGILGINFWQEGKKVTSRELNLATTFAHEMESVIEIYLLLLRATEAESRAWALAGLQNLMQSLTSPFNLRDVLEKIAKNALLTLDADNVTLYQFLADENAFYLPAITAGKLRTSLSSSFGLSHDKVLLEFVDKKRSQFIVDVSNHQKPNLAATFRNGPPRFVEREGIKSSAVLVLRQGEGEIVGLLFVNFCKRHEFSTEEVRAMDALASSAALAIRNARLHKDDLDKQLEAMNQVHAAIADKGANLTLVLQALLQQTLSLTGAKYGACMRWDQHAKHLGPVARWPERQDYPIAPQTMNDGIVGLAARSRRAILVDDIKDMDRTIVVETIGPVNPATIYKMVNPDTRSEIAVPLLDGDRLLGVLNIEHPEPRGLTRDHRILLQTLAVPAIIAFHTVELYKKLERRIRHLSALSLIAARERETPYELDTVLRMFLTGITAGSGLAFSRAMLFFFNDGRLRGEAAIGAVAQQRAQSVWDDFERMETPFATDLDSLLQRAERSRPRNRFR